MHYKPNMEEMGYDQNRGEMEKTLIVTWSCGPNKYFRWGFMWILVCFKVIQNHFLNVLQMSNVHRNRLALASSIDRQNDICQTAKHVIDCLKFMIIVDVKKLHGPDVQK